MKGRKKEKQLVKPSYWDSKGKEAFRSLAYRESALSKELNEVMMLIIVTIKTWVAGNMY